MNWVTVEEKITLTHFQVRLSIWYMKTTRTLYDRPLYKQAINMSYIAYKWSTSFEKRSLVEKREQKWRNATLIDFMGTDTNSTNMKNLVILW